MSDHQPSAPVASPESIQSLERKIAELESQVQKLERQLAAQESSVNGLAGRLPNTSLLSPKFLTRAFTVWGHHFVAQLIIVAPFYCIAIVLGLSGSGS